jgi:hypothetical protein
MIFFLVHLIFFYYSFIMTNYTIIKYKEFIVQFIKSLNKNTAGRKMKCSIEYYVDRILYVFKTGISWNNLETVNCTSSAVYKNFCKWNKLNIFRDAYIKLLNNVPITSSFKKLFIDSTTIQNECGFNYCTSYDGYKIPNKRSVKLTVICNQDKIPIGHLFSPSNIHDSKLIVPTLNNIKVSIKGTDNYPIKLVGDKGYISSLKSRNNLRVKKIQLVTPLRKNYISKPSNYNKNKKLFNKRIIIEHIFNDIKRISKRLSKIMDRKEDTLNAWLYMIFGVILLNNK